MWLTPQDGLALHEVERKTILQKGLHDSDSPLMGAEKIRQRGSSGLGFFRESALGCDSWGLP